MLRGKVHNVLMQGAECCRVHQVKKDGLAVVSSLKSSQDDGFRRSLNQFIQDRDQCGRTVCVVRTVRNDDQVVSDATHVVRQSLHPVKVPVFNLRIRCYSGNRDVAHDNVFDFGQVRQQDGALRKHLRQSNTYNATSCPKLDGAERRVVPALQKLLQRVWNCCVTDNCTLKPYY